MDRLEIGQTILRLRKGNNLTQEQLASLVGVSAGAVSKWETGNSTPDIALLSSLARALKTSIDNLLSFKQELSEEEVAVIKKALSDELLYEGYEAGEAKCLNYLKEYPHSISLKYIVAGLIQMYSMLAEERSDEFIKKKMLQSLAMFGEVAESRDPKYSPLALFSMAGIYLVLENYEECERVLKELPQTPINPMTLYPSVLLKQGKADEAARQCCIKLFQDINQSVLTLITMSRIAKEDKEYDNAIFYLDTAYSLQKMFGIGLHSAAYNRCKLHIDIGQKELAAGWFKIYISGLLGEGYDYKGNPYFEGIELEVPPDGQRVVRKKLLHSLIDEADLKVLSGCQDYDNSILKLKVALDSI